MSSTLICLQYRSSLTHWGQINLEDKDGLLLIFTGHYLFGSIIYSVDGNKNAFKVVRLRGLMLLSALLFFIWKICQ